MRHKLSRKCPHCKQLSAAAFRLQACILLLSCVQYAALSITAACTVTFVQCLVLCHDACGQPYLHLSHGGHALLSLESEPPPGSIPMASVALYLLYNRNNGVTEVQKQPKKLCRKALLTMPAHVTQVQSACAQLWPSTQTCGRRHARPASPPWLPQPLTKAKQPDCDTWPALQARLSSVTGWGARGGACWKFCRLSLPASRL